eukprot:TRINITY_DN25270_c0_g1_i1.p2 TRINITY_DN25270_c0_g1~~TRINITY_DN25270_c0_g1_i1.p2  ORF type:complete len:109 (-),score=5.52 TRINITY_DN25270_c0_g1_i1:73-399(-)
MERTSLTKFQHKNRQFSRKAASQTLGTSQNRQKGEIHQTYYSPQANSQGSKDRFGKQNWRQAHHKVVPSPVWMSSKISKEAESPSPNRCVSASNKWSKPSNSLSPSWS